MEFQDIVELMRIVAMVGDGHTALAPEFDERIGFHRFPIQLYDFYDGLFIISADSAHANLFGAKVITIGPSSSGPPRSGKRLPSRGGGGTILPRPRG